LYRVNIGQILNLYNKKHASFISYRFIRMSLSGCQLLNKQDNKRYFWVVFFPVPSDKSFISGKNYLGYGIS